jgi:hypothetical protein
VKTRKTTSASEAPPSPPAAKTRGCRLRTSENVRAELARVYRGLVGGAIEEGSARVRTYILQTLAAVIRDEKLADIEAQLADLRAAGVLK